MSALGNKIFRIPFVRFVAFCHTEFAAYLMFHAVQAHFGGPENCYQRPQCFQLSHDIDSGKGFDGMTIEKRW